MQHHEDIIAISSRKRSAFRVQCSVVEEFERFEEFEEFEKNEKYERGQMMHLVDIRDFQL